MNAVNYREGRNPSLPPESLKKEKKARKTPEQEGKKKSTPPGASRGPEET